MASPAAPDVPEEPQRQMPDAPRRQDQGQEPLRQLGHYLLRRPIGRGGMATVYEARDTQIERNVAIKLVDVPAHLPPDELEALVARMRREARAIGSLSHPNVVTILDVGEDNGLPFLVMEYLEGVTLRQRLDSGGALAPTQASVILAQVAAALEAAHRHGMLHRDIKPSNIMLVAPDGPDGSGASNLSRVKLLDFGVARQVGDTVMTRTGLMVGSPAYMAPEIIRGESATAAADIWALGVLLYEMLAGRPAFDGQTIPAVFYQILEQTPVPIASASPAIGRVLVRALEKNPEKRFGSATELANAFQTAATPPPPDDRVSTGNGSRKPRGGRTAGFVAAFVSVLAVVVTLITLLPRQKDRSGREEPAALSAPPRPSSPALLSADQRDRRAPMISITSGDYKPAVTAATTTVVPSRASAAAVQERKPSPGPQRRRKIPAAPSSGAAAARVRRAAPRPAASAASGTTRRSRPVPRRRLPPPGRPQRPTKSLHRQRQVPQPVRRVVTAKHRKASAPKRSLLVQKIQLGRDYIRLRKEARRVNRSNSAAIGAYNRKVYAFRRSRQQFNAAVKKTHRGQGK